MTAMNIERKVRQLDNDVSEIYTMLFDIQGTQKRHTHRLDELGTDIADLGTKMDAVQTRLTGVETTMDAVETRLTGVETKIDEVLDILRS
ncbi:hypothetical protein [uncultured Serinicoccus sp.]|uniref:hypothetical protein n=1 Tax=uncultured Serinicoccus sp. TaxID=735514 RepID=UPI00261C91AA|nr:hypothetical protein [uncultured Serinicoccus sp.]